MQKLIAESKVAAEEIHVQFVIDRMTRRKIRMGREQKVKDLNGTPFPTPTYTLTYTHNIHIFPHTTYTPNS